MMIVGKCRDVPFSAITTATIFIITIIIIITTIVIITIVINTTMITIISSSSPSYHHHHYHHRNVVIIIGIGYLRTPRKVVAIPSLGDSSCPLTTLRCLRVSASVPSDSSLI
jgi:hypothetical protein